MKRCHGRFPVALGSRMYVFQVGGFPLTDIFSGMLGGCSPSGTCGDVAGGGIAARPLRRWNTAARGRGRKDNMIRSNRETISNWDAIRIARHPDPPTLTDHIKEMVRNSCELHGARKFGDDRAMITGFGTIDGHRVMLVGNERGKDTI